MNAVEHWVYRSQTHAFMSMIKRTPVQAQFLQIAKAEEQVEETEHQLTLLCALAQGRLSIEKALIKAASEKNMMKFIGYTRDLNMVHSLIWKIEQDVKNGKEVR